jgi:hypothetical protein
LGNKNIFVRVFMAEVVWLVVKNNFFVVVAAKQNFLNNIFGFW